MSTASDIDISGVRNVKSKIDSRKFRDVLSAYPTGVCVVAAQSHDGRKHAMAVGSFSSISLDPPLVGFCPAKTSSSAASQTEDAGSLASLSRI
ncbi:flavin reductase [Sphingomonas populi]|uniref:Flavin reductase n=1 Tax=Sphingomonas populi TaxID=2484750 RepID=A0A4Q6XRN9_9SPHN|nr:flavin reductase [Sphingomonas populi]